jgi:hypothetical protein
VEKAIKATRNKKATGDDDIHGDLLKLLGEGSLKIVMKLIDTIYETGEWPKDVTEVRMIALKKKPQATTFIKGINYKFIIFNSNVHLNGRSHRLRIPEVEAMG